MNEGLISKRYAKALLDFASTLGEEEVLYRRMDALLQNTIAEPHLQNTLQSPMVASGDKYLLLCTAMGGGALENSVKKFADLLLQNQRENLAQKVAVCYSDLYQQKHHISKVALTSAEPLSATVLERVRADIEKRTRGTVELSTHTDPNLGGGILLQIGDLRLDATVAGQLKRVKKEMAK
ncbi:ATP synthase subunit delta [Bacteroidia bacterium]|nr:ATP synthase subunit delta [Bacteroidia bacterium]